MKKIVHFQMAVKLPKIALFLKIWPFLEFSDSCQSEFVMKKFKICDFGHLRCDFRKFEEIQIHFLQKSLKIAQNCRDWILSRWIQIGKNLRIPKMVNLKKKKQFLAIWQSFENEQFFSMHFYSITHMKVGNPFIFVKLL